MRSSYVHWSSRLSKTPVWQGFQGEAFHFVCYSSNWSIWDGFRSITPVVLRTNKSTRILSHQTLEWGLGAVFPKIEIHHLLAAVVMAEELSFTRAARILRISQPALSRQITDLEGQLGFLLFTRHKKRVVELTDAGRVFVKEARSARSHIERAVLLGRAANEGSDSILLIGYSPNVDHAWISAMFAIHLPLYPTLEIRLVNQCSTESFRSVLVGELNFALVTAPPKDALITAVPFSVAPLYAALPESHSAAHKQQLVLQDLASDQWILFPKRFDPQVHEAIMDTARRKSIIPRHAHEVIAAQQAVDLVSEHIGVAIFSKPAARFVACRRRSGKAALRYVFVL
jgi:DNA-binding transcriptional LysR family regulator